MKKSYIIVLLVAIMATSTAWHKFYLSVTQVEFVPEEHSVQVITRLFYDDLQKALQERYDSSIRVEKSYDQKKLNAFINKYIQQKFKLKINGNPAQLHYLGHKDENDYVVCFLETTDINEVKSLEIENTLLMDAFTEQKNVIHTQVGDTHKSFMLTAERDTAVLNIDE
ncbi:MAG TPA: peptidase E [Leeuwenhoekiella sp.]|nr:peptidase E [Leeuwenhoekiella sp.]